MSSHPLYGTKPLADALRVRCSDWTEADGRLFLWKLQRTRSNGSKEIHPTAGRSGRPCFVGSKELDGPGSDVRQWSARFPGWEIVPA